MRDAFIKELARKGYHPQFCIAKHAMEAFDAAVAGQSSPETATANGILEAVTDELLAHGEFSSGWNNRLNAREAARVVIDMVRTYDHAQCQQQPIAWRWRIKNANGDASGWALQFHKPNISKDVLHDEEPLFAIADTSTDQKDNK